MNLDPEIDLTGWVVVVAGGDVRERCAARRLAAAGATVYTVWLEGPDKETKETAKGQIKMLAPEADEMAPVLSSCDLLLFPVRGLREQGRLPVSSRTAPVEWPSSWWDWLNAETVVIAGRIPAEVERQLERRSIRWGELLSRDDFALLNAVPTAEGAVEAALAASKRTLWAAEVAVLGYGRCGKILAQTLAGLGSKVTVVARRNQSRVEARLAGYKAVPLRNLSGRMERFQFVFNTVPARVLTENRIRKLPGDAVILDIASAPGGTDFEAADAYGIDARLLPGLPGKTAPETAGAVLSHTAVRMARETRRSRLETGED